jgi:hypothetical protein
MPPQQSPQQPQVPHQLQPSPQQAQQVQQQPQQLNEHMFPKAISLYLQQEDHLAKLQVEMSKAKKEHAVLGNHVLHYMRTTGKPKYETERVNFVVSESVAQKPLSMELLQDVFKSQFPSRPDVCDTLCKAIRDQRRQGAAERVRLKRIKRRQPL